MSTDDRPLHWSLVLHVLVFAFAFAMQIALTRWAESTAAFGSYAFHLSLAQSLAIIAGLGIPSAAIRFLSRHLAHQQEAQARELARRAYLLVIASGFVVAVLLCLGAWLFRGTLSVAMWWAGAMIPLYSLRFMSETWAKTQHRTTLTLLPGGVLHPLLVLLLCAAWVGLQPGRLNAEELLAVGVVSLFVCTLGQTIWLGRTAIRFPASSESKNDDLEPPSRFSQRELLRVALPMLLVAGLGIAMSQCDVLMLRWLAGDAATGEYAVAVRISWVIVLPLISVNLLAAPTYASMWELQAIDAMRQKAHEFSRYIFVGTIPIALLLVIFGTTILAWHGPDYRVSYVPLLILIVGQIVNAAVGSTALLLSMTGHQDVVARVFAPCAILNVIANAILIPRYGTVGAAIATAVSLSLWNFVLLGLIWRKLKLDTSWWCLLPGGKHRFDGAA